MGDIELEDLIEKRRKDEEKALKEFMNIQEKDKKKKTCCNFL